MDSARICVVGSANMDLIWQGPHLPAAGETVSGGEFFSALGGKGANQASAAARLGAQVSFVGCVGNDAYGDEIKQDFSARGVDATFMRVIDAATTGTALINVDAAGENTIAVAPGANRHVTREQIEEAIEALRPEILVVGFEIGVEAASHALAIGRERSLRTICNPSPIDLTDSSWILNSTTIVLNETECEAYGGASSLLESGAGDVVVTLGANGARRYRKDGSHEEFKAFSIEVLDTTGAGDAFCAALAVSDDPIFAGAAGALATGAVGARSSLPTRSEVEALIREQQ